MMKDSTVRATSLLERKRLQLWGGIECTVNRVGESFYDQLLLSGHLDRHDDLDHFADLGFEALRYPLLWERTAPEGLAAADWCWSDRQLTRLQKLGIAPILGLVHHGSGPRCTNLLDDSFASGLGEYASAVARRYPWVEAYTPVNEPLTTARFSALYGHWYPHQHSDEAFATALINECLAIALAMRAIRQINPDAKLVLTEDLAKIHSTPLLREQAAFENERRWLSVDLLLGRVTPEHPLWSYLACSSKLIDRLRLLSDAPCAPDLLGFNYYLTSERMLDERLEHYHPSTHGGNGRQRYVDVEAVRARSEGVDGALCLLQEAWARYALPMAITEVHLNGHREDQVRWLLDSWAVAHELRSRGVDMRAVTIWSLLGATDWNSLCTRPDGCYEPGAFDVRGGKLRPTALARAARQLADDEPVDRLYLPKSGWWQSEDRLCHPPVSTARSAQEKAIERLPFQPQVPPSPIVIIGDGALDDCFARVCQDRRLACLTHEPNASPDDTAQWLDQVCQEHPPWAIVNALPLSSSSGRAGPVAPNRFTALAAHLARRCTALDIPLLTFSSHFVFDGRVFDGRLVRSYRESDARCPFTERGQTDSQTERLVLAECPRSLVVRVGELLSAGGGHGFLSTSLRQMVTDEPVWMVEDYHFSLSYVPDLVHASLDLLIDQETGVWHLTNPGSISWVDCARQVAELMGLPTNGLHGCPGAKLSDASLLRVARLESERGELLAPLSAVLEQFSRESAERWCRDVRKELTVDREEATDVA